MIFLYEKIEYGHLSHNTRDEKGIFMKKKWIALLTAALLLAGWSPADVARETGVGRGAIELMQEMMRRQLAESNG